MESELQDIEEEHPHPYYSFRTIWISDIHLGTKDCKADYLLDFFRHTHSEKLYLVGDIIDGWRLKRGWHWPEAHSTVMQKVLRKSRKGAQVVFIPGNHDAFLRDYLGINFGGITVLKSDIHHTIDGKRLLVMHGDEFDAVIKYAPWLAYIGDHAYVLALRVNHYVNLIREKLGLPYWSLSAMLKQKVKKAVQLIGDFEHFLAQAAKKMGMDGVVCGHIHCAEMREIEGILYCNDGDWVESCTALVEHYDGRLQILHWTDIMQARTTLTPDEEQLALFS